eukprot:4761906-Pleurochrysis_carterae.AAC.11
MALIRFKCILCGLTLPTRATIVQDLYDEGCKVLGEILKTHQTLQHVYLSGVSTLPRPVRLSKD